MIPSQHPGYYPHHDAEPPTPLELGQAELSLFTPRHSPLRKLVVMVDSELLPWPGPGQGARATLHWQLNRPNVVIYGYPGCRDYLPFRGRESLTLSQYRLDHVDEEVRPSHTAGLLGVDCYVTAREALLSARRWTRPAGMHHPPEEPPCFAVPDAVAFVGLYLRAQGDFLPPGGPRDGAAARPAGLYRFAALSGVPALRAWTTGTTGTDEFAGRWDSLTETVSQRLQEALVQRDQFHMALRRTGSPSSVFDVFARLDSCLQLLMAALDASARMAHLLLSTAVGADGLGSPHTAAWHRGAWLKSLRQRRPDVYGLVARGTTGWHVMTVLRSLRNTIHSVSLMERAATARDRWGEIESGLRLPADLGADFWTALAALADDDWTLGPCGPGDEVGPGELLENLFPRVLDLLDRLLGQIPVGGRDVVPRSPDPDRDHRNYFYPESCRLHFGLPPHS